MKVVLHICTFTLICSILSGCGTPPRDKPLNVPVENHTTSFRRDFSGHIYKSKAVLNLESVFIETERYSSCENKTANDTLHPYIFDGFSANLENQPKGKSVVKSYVSSGKGEQFKFSLPGKIKVWNNAYTLQQLRWLGGKVFDIKLYHGETYIVSAQPLTICLNDSLIVTTSAGSKFNIRKYDEDRRIVISVAKGKVKVSGKSYDGKPDSKIIPHGIEMNLVSSPLSGGLHSFDVRKIASWRKGGKFFFDNEYPSDVLEALGRWYNAIVVYKKIAPDCKFSITLPYNKPLDTALNRLSYVVPFTLTRRDDTIYVQ